MVPLSAQQFILHPWWSYDLQHDVLPTYIQVDVYGMGAGFFDLLYVEGTAGLLSLPHYSTTLKKDARIEEKRDLIQQRIIPAFLLEKLIRSRLPKQSLQDGVWVTGGCKFFVNEEASEQKGATPNGVTTAPGKKTIGLKDFLNNGEQSAFPLLQKCSVQCVADTRALGFQESYAEGRDGQLLTKLVDDMMSLDPDARPTIAGCLERIGKLSFFKK